ncbi:MAG TPA: restriction endonuclease [Ktedonobacterales bacterium]
MSRRRKRKKEPLSLHMSLILDLFMLVLLVYLIAAHYWRLAALLGACLLVGTVTAVVLFRRRIRHKEHWRDRVSTLNDLIRLTPTQFELITVELLRTRGYRHVHHTGGGGDLAADITCHTPQGSRAVVQCKRYAPHRPVGSPEIQKFIGMMRVHHHAQVGIFVTTSTYTYPARALAKQHGLMLLDGPYLEGLVKQFRIQQQRQVPAPA